MLYGRQRDYLAGTSQNRVESATAVSQLANWRVEQAGAGAFRLRLPAAGNRGLSSGGALSLGTADVFTLVSTSGCAAFPEVETERPGLPRKGTTSYTETRGLLDAHIHMMAFEFLGGRAHCGRPWSQFGAAERARRLPRPLPGNGGARGARERARSATRSRTHDPVGWPTFKDWPNHDSLTHEHTYYRWLERAWLRRPAHLREPAGRERAALRALPAQAEQLRRDGQRAAPGKRIRELEDYIDAQAGGPGKGFFRIVTDPFQAREVINEGKLAVVLGIEVSELVRLRRLQRPADVRRSADRRSSTRSTSSACATWRW